MKRERGMGMALALAIMVLIASAASAAINPATYGAKGDGVQDDTAAIQKALDEAGKTSDSVILPAGNYLLTNSLQIPEKVTLQSETPRWENTAVILTVRKEGFPAIRMVGGGAAVKGLCIVYPDNRDMVHPKKYPAAIQLESTNPCVTDVHFRWAWDGISTKPGGQNAGQAEFRNITGFVHNCGIRLDGCLDIVHVEHVHLFVDSDKPDDPSYYYRQNRVAFEFGRVDGLFMDSCFMILGKTFVRVLPQTGDGKPTHCLGFAITNCWTEWVKQGFDVEGICGMSVTNCHVLLTEPDGFGFRFTMPSAFYNLALANVQVRYADKGTGPAVIYNPTAKHPLTKLSITGSLFYPPDDNKGYPTVDLGAGARNFLFTSNYLSGNPAIRIHPEAKYINISGNNIAGKIDDRITSASVGNISGNITVDAADLLPK